MLISFSLTNVLQILGLDICADTLVGDPIRRGISGGQKKRLTTGSVDLTVNETMHAFQFPSQIKYM
jgi:hypothetical protein